MATIKDIAELADVSTATVSRILSNDPSLSVSNDTRKRVMEIVNDLNYKPTRKKSEKFDRWPETHHIGLLLTNTEEDEVNDPYFMSLRMGVERTCEQYGMNIASVLTVGNRDLSGGALRSLDGLIVIGTVDSKELKDNYYENNNIVFVDYAPPGNEFDVVISDLETATYQILEHLFELGHQNISYLGGRLFVKGIDKGGIYEKEDVRKSIFENVMKEKGLYKHENVLIGEWGPNGGYMLMKELINKGQLPSAVVVASDPMALGAFRALHEAGVKVPEEVSIFSFDNIDAAAYLNPALSTVKIHSFEMGKTAVKLLSDRLKGRDLPLKVVLPTELVFRESVSRKKD
ncbi:LacI family DNA-binding transcriptional regulator [Metabacillus litoralis]|uniref:LacI family DNA-binding transcriptional regulator n=1 Tax=Metabacillus litoralis TaxID=152268 RepID=UPI00203FF6B3|nr:LacI family DNA-binding transcriptional regulator [Metabacillus litoralis]MCM3654268.1 LacI family DNA-binding transcriptional regulator [Metabacillus litoralis]